MALNPAIQPLTFSGVADFSRASWTRLLIVQGLVALLAAGVAVWFIATAWDPIVRAAIAHLPEESEIRGGVLDWRGPPALTLAGDRFLSFEVDVAEEAETGGTADFQIEFARAEFRLRSVLGYLPLPYPSGWLIALNRTELEPWWNAWRPALLAGAGLIVVLWLFICWASLATIYCVPVWMMAFYSDRELPWSGAWKLSCAALLPGGVLMSMAIAAYGWQQINLLQLLFAFALHLAVGWVYLFAAPFCLPKIGSFPVRRNPFAVR